MHNPTITRRTVTRAAAWSMPVVVAAAAAPAASASPGPATALIINGPTSAQTGTTWCTYGLSAIDSHGVATQIPNGSRLSVPGGFTPMVVTGGSWSWVAYVFTSDGDPAG